MTQRIILLTVRRKKDAVVVLTKQNDHGFDFVASEVARSEHPLEAAVRTAEAIFGEESVCTLWQLGNVEEGLEKTVLYCLDFDAIDQTSTAVADDWKGYGWIEAEEALALMPPNLTPVARKILAYKIT